MPLYEYTNEEHGLAIDLPFAVADRPDEIVLKRKTVPSRVSVRGFVSAPTSGAADQVLAGYQALEDTGRLGTSEFSADQIKRAWSTPTQD